MITEKLVSDAFNKISLKAGTSKPSVEYCKEFFNEYAKKIEKEEFFFMCKSILEKEWKQFPNFYQWNLEYKNLCFKRQEKEVNDRVFSKPDIASQDEISETLKQLSDKFKTTSIEDNEIKRAIKRRKEYRVNNYVCCMEKGLEGAMKRDVCMQNGYRFNEY